MLVRRAESEGAGVKPVRVLSFGAGTQSSAVLGLIEEGKLPPVDFAVFADTQAEPDDVYAWLEKIRAWSKTKLIIATKGDLFNATMAGTVDRSRFPSLPFWTVRAGELEGIARRQCTKEYKIEVVHRAVRQELGYAPRQRVKHQVEMLIAMSLEEVGRMRDSREAWIKNSYPLIFDIPMHRQQSIEYVKTLGLGEPPRSSCIMCPFHSNLEWRRLRDREPHNWRKVIGLDRAIRQLPRLRAQTFLHSSRIPLEDVDLDAESPQLDLFQNDCTGMCGA